MELLQNVVLGVGFNKIVKLCNYDFSFNEYLKNNLQLKTSEVLEIQKILNVLYNEIDYFDISLVGGIVKYNNNYHGDIDFWIFSENLDAVHFLSKIVNRRLNLNLVNFSYKHLRDSNTAKAKVCINSNKIFDIHESKVSTNSISRIIKKNIEKYPNSKAIVPIQKPSIRTYCSSYLIS